MTEIPFAVFRVFGIEARLTEAQFRQAVADFRHCRCGECLCCRAGQYAAALTATQIKNLGTAEIQALTTDQIGKLSTTQIQALTTADAQALTTAWAITHGKGNQWSTYQAALNSAGGGGGTRTA